MNPAAAAVVILKPTPEWTKLPGNERLKWLRDEVAVLRESGYGADDSRAIWAKNLRGADGGIIVLMLWYIADRAALDRLVERMQSPKITKYFTVNVEASLVAKDDDEIIKYFLGLPFG